MSGKKNSRIIFLVALLLMITSKTEKFIFADEKWPLVAPFEDKGNNLVAEIRVNGEPLKFLIDTGAEHTVFNRSLAKKLKIPLKDTGNSLSGVGDKKFNIYEGQAESFEFGELKLGKTTLRSVDLEVMNRGASLNIDGLLGIDFLSKHAFTIDYQAEEMRFYQNTSLPEDVRKEAGQAVSVQRGGKLILIPLTFDKDKAQRFAMVDTGAVATLTKNSIGKTLAEKFDCPNLPGPPANGIGGRVETKVVAMRKAKLGDIDLTNVYVATVPDDHFIALAKETKKKDLNVLLGNNIMNRFRIAFDFKDNKMYFKAYEEKTEDMLQVFFVTPGIFLKSAKGKITIAGFMKGSLAGEKGVQVNDELVQVDNALVEGAELTAVYQRLGGSADSEVSLKLLRDGNAITVSLPRYDLLTNLEQHSKDGK